MTLSASGAGEGFVGGRVGAEFKGRSAGRTKQAQSLEEAPSGNKVVIPHSGCIAVWSGGEIKLNRFSVKEFVLDC